MSILCCPVCGKLLKRTERTYICENNHSYDIAKSGYVNLLLANQMNSKLPGDNKLMVQARSDFLNKEYYRPMADKLCEAVKKYYKDNTYILDAGCGEGYYTQKISDFLQNKAKIIGIDISKNAISIAAKRTKKVEFATGSVFNLPVLSSSCNLLMTLFAPYCGEEFSRILTNDGIMIMVIPSKKHLWELKKAIYDKPYLNQVKNYQLENFEMLEKISVNEKIFLPCNKDIANLFTMTPYYYKTSIEGSKKISELSELETEIGFEILVYKKLFCQ